MDTTGSKKGNRFMSPYNAKENLLKTHCQNEIKNKS